MPVERTPCDMDKVVARMKAAQATYAERDLEKEFADMDAEYDAEMLERLKLFDENGYLLDESNRPVLSDTGFYVIPMSGTYEQMAQFVLSERKRLGVVSSV